MTYTPMNAGVMSFVMYDSEVQETIEDLIVTLVHDGHADAASKVAWVYGMSTEQWYTDVGRHLNT